MKVLMFSIDAKIFEEGSAVRALMTDYAGVVDELAIIVYTPPGFTTTTLAKNATAYPTNTRFRFMYFTAAYYLGKTLMRKMGSGILTAQDAQTGLVAWRLSRAMGWGFQQQVHVDFTAEAYRAESVGNAMRLRLYRFVLRRAQAIRVVSTRIAAALPAIGVHAPVSVLPIFVDIHSIESLSPVPLHEQYPQFNFIIAMMGRLTKEKDFRVAISAFASLRKRNPRAGLVIFGEGPLRRSLIQYAGLLDVDDGVVFAGFDRDALSKVKGADAVMVTSRYEGYGRMLVEAAAMRRPIITTPVGIVGDILTESNGVAVCPVGDAECFATKLFDLVRDNHLRLVMGSTARDAVFERVCADKAQYLSMIREGFEQAAHGL